MTDTTKFSSTAFENSAMIHLYTFGEISHESPLRRIFDRAEAALLDVGLVRIHNSKPTCRSADEFIDEVYQFAKFRFFVSDNARVTDIRETLQLDNFAVVTSNDLTSDDEPASHRVVVLDYGYRIYHLTGEYSDDNILALLNEAAYVGGDLVVRSLKVQHWQLPFLCSLAVDDRMQKYVYRRPDWVVVKRVHV